MAPLEMLGCVTGPQQIRCALICLKGRTVYACSAGAGSKIVRCEVTLDQGKSWLLADITHRAAPNAYGKHWAWVWWQVEVPLGES